ncbi:MAG TPA: LysM peptidoglycan-binding domain-containing protein [Frankiaceae bacterium]|nr:LysM peptidoglycan-binding domain-containing protein [Frankiaceae bacterium]
MPATRRNQPRPAEKPGLHLTRRGRLVALLLLFVVLTVAFSVGRVTSTALGDPNAPAAEVIVQRGDTLWSIAERIAPDADPRATARDLMAVNGLGSPSLEAGQHLRLP